MRVPFSRQRSRRFGLHAILCLAALLAACRSVPVPSEQLGAARAAYEDAIQAGAAEYAPHELAAANAKLDRARGLNAQKDYAEARRMAEQAEVDARLAASKARGVRAGRELGHAEESLRAISQRPTTSSVVR